MLRTPAYAGHDDLVNVTGEEHTREENLAALAAGAAVHRRRTYDDRIINTFDDGFVIQYTLNGVHHNGHRGALWICIVGRCRDGQITRIDEYVDAGKFPAWRGDVPATEPAPSDGGAR